MLVFYNQRPAATPAFMWHIHQCSACQVTGHECCISISTCANSHLSVVVFQGFDAAAQQQLFQRLLSAGICFHGYQQLSYMILSRVTPVTHSIGNCVKRVVVILASVVAFQHPMSTQNALGEFEQASLVREPQLLLLLCWPRWQVLNSAC